MPTKFEMVDPSLTLGGTELKCHGKRLSMLSELNPATDTWCSKGVIYKVVSENFQSFGADGFETLVRPLVNTQVELILKPDDATASVDNPHFKGTVKVAPFNIVDAGASEGDGHTTLNISWTFVEGTVMKDIGSGFAAI